jgi:hypothetical protein
MRGNPKVNPDSSVNRMDEQGGRSLSGRVTPKPDKELAQKPLLG